MNSIFWFGVALGFIANIIASHCWELVARYRAWKTARKLIGTWVAYKIHGRTVDTNYYTDARCGLNCGVCEAPVLVGRLSSPRRPLSRCQCF